MTSTRTHVHTHICIYPHTHTHMIYGQHKGHSGGKRDNGAVRQWGARGGVLSVWGLGGSEGGSEGVKKGGIHHPLLHPGLLHCDWLNGLK